MQTSPSWTISSTSPGLSFTLRAMSVSSRRRETPRLRSHPFLHPVHPGLRFDRGVLALAVNQAGAAPSVERAVLVLPDLAGEGVAVPQRHFAVYV